MQKTLLCTCNVHLKSMRQDSYLQFNRYYQKVKEGLKTYEYR